MPLESGDTIAALDLLWPLAGDDISQGDDHLRLIKNVLKKQFPGENGDGFDQPIIATENEINALQGFQYNWTLEQWLWLIQLDYKSRLHAPEGTVMMFAQPNPPIEWTQLVDEDNRSVRLSSVAGGGLGGVDNPYLLPLEHTHETAEHILDITEMPAHQHTLQFEGKNTAGIPDNAPPKIDAQADNENANGTINQLTNVKGGDQPHTHGTTDFGTIKTQFEPRYVDVIMATKDPANPPFAPGP